MMTIRIVQLKHPVSRKSTYQLVGYSLRLAQHSLTLYVLDILRELHLCTEPSLCHSYGSTHEVEQPREDRTLY